MGRFDNETHNAGAILPRATRGLSKVRFVARLLLVVQMAVRIARSDGSVFCSQRRLCHPDMMLDRQAKFSRQPPQFSLNVGSQQPAAKRANPIAELLNIAVGCSGHCRECVGYRLPIAIPQIPESTQGKPL